MRNPVLWSISVTLAQQVWTYDAIAAHLTARVPRPLARLIPKAALNLRQALPGEITPDAETIYPVLARMALGQRLILHPRQEGRAPTSNLSEPPFRPAEALAALNLPALTTPVALADWLAIPPQQLTRMADLRGLSAHSADPFGPHYILHHIPKADGSLRLIEEPKPLLKHLQRRILTGILNLVPPHPAAYGFTLGRNALQAAAKHCGEQMVVAFDLKDFFPSINFPRTYAIFRTLGYPRAVAMPLTGLCTALPINLPNLPDGYRNRHLPQGAPTSPAIANLTAFRLDARLTGLARSLGATYTRYADDLTFSGDARIAPILLEAVPAIIKAEGFHPNPAKTRIQPAAQAQRVTGVMVNHHLNLPRRDYDQLKAILHHLARNDPRRHDPAYLAHLNGRIHWAEQVNPSRAARLRALFDAL